jgi:hypothetical protein
LYRYVLGVVSGAASAAAAAANLMQHIAGSVAPQYAIAARDKCGLRYQGAASRTNATFVATVHPREVGLCTLNQVDP